MTRRSREWTGPNAAVPAPLALPGDRVVIQGNRSRLGTYVDGVVKTVWYTLRYDDRAAGGYWQYSVWVEHHRPARPGKRERTGYYCHVGDEQIEVNYTAPIAWEIARPGDTP